MARNVSLVGRIPGLRHVPFNIPVPVDAAGGAYAWVGQGHTKAAGVLSFSTLTIPPAKGVGFVVVAEELLKGAQGSAKVLRDALVSGLARFMDKQFTDPHRGGHRRAQSRLDHAWNNARHEHRQPCR